MKYNNHLGTKSEFHFAWYSHDFVLTMVGKTDFTVGVF